jgi:signal transduction histidine kinase
VTSEDGSSEAARAEPTKALRVYVFLYLLNLVIIAFYSLILYSTVFRICDADQALSFLKTARYLPAVPWRIPAMSCGLFLLVGLLNLLQYRNRGRQWLIFGFYICNLCLCCAISWSLNLSYKGFFLLLIAEAFLNLQAMPLKILSLLLTFAGFIVFDYDILSVSIKMASFHNYLTYYAPQTRILLYCLKTTLDSLNLILVVLFFYMLIQGKIRENKEFIRVNTELETNLETLRRMNAEIEEAAKIKERNRLARDVHDILGHSLTCIDTGLEAGIALASGTSEELAEQLRKVKRFADNGLRDIRRSVRELEKDSIRSQTLIEAIEELSRDINAAKVHRVKLRIEGDPLPMEYDERQIAYRMVQESITNSVNHGAARNIEIALAFRGSELELRTSDDGRGCAEIRENFGLSHMREEAALLNGSIEFSSRPGGGFSIRAALPIRRHPE